MQGIGRDEILASLNAENRLDNLRALVRQAHEGKLPLPRTTQDVNNHIHTTFSFSPYSPTAAAWFAWQAGLCTAGLMDHDSIAGAQEFIEACRIVGIVGTIGIECRVNMAGTPFERALINNPDQRGVMYTMIHGVPHNQAGRLNEAFAPYRERRNARNRMMVDAANGLLRKYGVSIDFDKDVLPLSNWHLGGTVTERHISSALAYRMIDVVGKGAPLVRFIKQELALPLSNKIESLLMDESNPHMMYDLLGWIKAELISKFYIDATDELMGIREFLQLSESLNGISACSYLGDVGDSVTGDKRAQKFEDDYLDELMQFNEDLGYRACTYAPSRNTKAQFDRLRALCAKHGFFEISGEDINTPRQSFVCEAQRDPSFRNLYDATWALIAHERLAAEDPARGFFSDDSIAKWPQLNERVRAFAALGLQMR